MDYLRRALDSENRSLVNELAELRIKASANATPVTPLPPQIDVPEPLAVAVMNDFWAQSRVRQRTHGSNKKKGRTVQDLHEVKQLFFIIIYK